MFISSATRPFRAVSVVVAAAIVSVSGLAMDRGHLGEASRTTAESTPLRPADVLPTVYELPEVIVTAPRLAVVTR